MEKSPGYAAFLVVSAIIIVLCGLIMRGPSLLQPMQLSVLPVSTFTIPQQLLQTSTSSSREPQEAVPAEPTIREQATSTEPLLFQYIEVVNGCGPYYEGTCVNMRSGPGTEYPVVGQLRNGMVLKVAGTVVQGGHTWYKVGFDGDIHYPERIIGDWYVSADYVGSFLDVGEIETTAGINRSSTKRIVIDLAQEMLYAFDGQTLFMQQAISTGLELTPTSLGTFSVYRKMPDSYMQGPVPGVSDQYYDLPGVPWDLYFNRDGSAIHGAYWHNKFGQPWSHGCVNLPPNQAHELYLWAELGTPVIVLD